ncbi:C39 family peptidase [Leptospira sp. 'Mane']|uniref:C39 family peptidase n=1 Tax=Leptospira sp. 'Mane' TaxID=3387407 RepID=UPI00398A529D
MAREAALDDVNGIVDPEKLAALALATVGTAIAGAVAFVGLGGRTNNTPTNSQPTDIVTPARRRKDGEEGPLDILVEGVTDLGRMVSDWWNDTPAINPLVASKADAALVAAAVYSDVPMEKKLELLGKSENPFKILGPDDFRGTPLENLRFVDHEKTGLDSMLVKRTMIIDGQARTVYVYALAGTEGGVFSNDGATNASAVVGNSSQYELALKNAKLIQEYLNEKDPNAILLTTGHSLGGGMAASISLQTGIPAITFNPAGTNFLTNGISNAFNTGWNQIDAYITPTDPVNAVQRLLFPLIGPNGRTHSETILTPSGIFDGHSISNFVDHYFPNTTNPIPKDTVVRQPENLNHFINEDGALDINRLNNELNLTTPERERVLRLNEELREAERTLERSSLLADNNSNVSTLKWEEAKKNLAKVKENLNSLIKNTAMGFGYSPTANVITVGKPEITARPLNVSEVSNSSADLQQKFVEAAELPNVNDFKKGESLKLKFPEDTSPEKIHETLEKVGTQMIKDAYFNYDASIKSKDLLEKFAKENGLNSPNATNEQKQIYQKLQTELNTAIANSKADPLKARIDYTRENYARITTETLVNKYGDKIDTESSTARVTVLKDGEGMILNQVAYDSQRDNTSKIEFSDYVLYPGNECSPTATSIAAEYMGATSQNGMYQFVDDFIKQAHNDGILSDGDELKKDKYLTKVLAKYDQKLVPLKVDLIPKPGTNPVKYESDSAGWKTDSIKVALNEGKPVVVGGEFNVSPVIGGHRLVIVGYDSTGWIVHDPYGNANNSGYQGSGMYAHYDYGKWDIGKTPTAFVIENIPKKE